MNSCGQTQGGTLFCLVYVVEGVATYARTLAPLPRVLAYIIVNLDKVSGFERASDATIFDG